MHFRTSISTLLTLVLLAPLTAGAVSPIVVAGWIPYWAKTAGTQEATTHLALFRELSPFSYTVTTNGTTTDTMKIDAGPWPDLFVAASSTKTAIIPSVLWNDGAAIHTTLMATSTRTAHETALLALLDTHPAFSGLDIDYENKKAETQKGFSLFLTELSSALHAKKKTLVCTIEPRTPAASAFKVLPKDMARANDYVVIGKVCDVVRIMAYDQGTIDLTLNDTKAGYLYAPVADTTWVKKVISEATKGGIPKKKIELGVATYGYEYSVTITNGKASYSRLRSIGETDALALASSTQSVIRRNVSGEASFGYNKDGAIRFVTWSDPKAVAGKIALARSLGLRGIVLFKIDGKSDPKLWSILH